jgi:hypothetical protein
VEINNNSFSFSADEEQMTMDNDDGSQLDAVAVAARRLLGDGLLMGIS